MDNLNQVILVTGANGLLGSHIVKQLVEQSHTKVIALVRESSDMTLLEEVLQRIEVRHSDILDLVNLEKQLAGVDVIIHSAAMVSFDPKKLELMMRVNGQGTANIVNIALDHQVKRLVYVSSIAAIGRRKKVEHISEKSKWTGSSYNTDYAVSKYQGEQEAWRGYYEGLSTVIINPALILGKGDYSKTSIAMVDRLAGGQAFYPTGTNGVVDVIDVANACIKSISADVEGERIIASADSISYQDVFAKFALAFGNRPPRYPVKPWLRGIVWRLAKVAAMLTGKSPLLTKQSMTNLSMTCTYDNSKSKELLGMSYRSIDDTIEEIVQDYKGRMAD